MKARLPAGYLPARKDGHKERIADWPVADITRFLKRYKPRIAVVFVGGRGGAAYQLPMWLPFIERIGARYVLVTQDSSLVGQLSELTDAPVLVAPISDTEAIKTSLILRIRLAFYVRNTKENRPYIAQREMTHIFLNHGDSDKPANFSKMHRDFDKIFVCGEAGVERYARHGVEIPRSKFEIVGRPQVGTIDFHPEPAPTDRPLRVLYAPTWEGLHDYDHFSSLPVGDRIVKSLISHGATVIFRPHPLSRKPAEIDMVNAVIDVLKADAAASGRKHIWGEQAETEWSVADCVNESDALISDVSSVVSDYLASAKPYALVAMDRSVEEFKDEFASAASGYVIDKELETIEDQLSKMLGDDPLREARLERRRYVLGGMTGDEAAAEFVATAKRLMKRPIGSDSATVRKIRKKLSSVKKSLLGQPKR
ncbi:CDP-glycerol glycerophosphotransferase, TagB/SpsB family [Micrococcales bacterium KH10]|nr:CDP-glycerol glycerophosphotransferase, TagB/SpsB family [Micrococcales bacterium KH10]